MNLQKLNDKFYYHRPPLFKYIGKKRQQDLKYKIVFLANLI